MSHTRYYSLVSGRWCLAISFRFRWRIRGRRRGRTILRWWHIQRSRNGRTIRWWCNGTRVGIARRWNITGWGCTTGIRHGRIRYWGLRCCGIRWWFTWSKIHKSDVGAFVLTNRTCRIHGITHSSVAGGVWRSVSDSDDVFADVDEDEPFWGDGISSAAEMDEPFGGDAMELESESHGDGI